MNRRTLVASLAAACAALAATLRLPLPRAVAGVLMGWDRPASAGAADGSRRNAAAGWERRGWERRGWEDGRGRRRGPPPDAAGAGGRDLTHEAWDGAGIPRRSPIRRRPDRRAPGPTRPRRRPHELRHQQTAGIDGTGEHEATGGHDREAEALVIGRISHQHDEPMALGLRLLHGAPHQRATDALALEGGIDGDGPQQHAGRPAPISTETGGWTRPAMCRHAPCSRANDRARCPRAGEKPCARSGQGRKRARAGARWRHGRRGFRDAGRATSRAWLRRPAAGANGYGLRHSCRPSSSRDPEAEPCHERRIARVILARHPGDRAAPSPDPPSFGARRTIPQRPPPWCHGSTGQAGMTTSRARLLRMDGGLGAFALAVCGWGLGFYGPPIFLHVIHETRGWPLASSPRPSRRITSQAPRRSPTCRASTPASASSGDAGRRPGPRPRHVGWSLAAAPWQLFNAAIVSGLGWATLGAAAVNAIVSPWFARDARRPSPWPITARASAASSCHRSGSCRSRWRAFPSLRR